MTDKQIIIDVSQCPHYKRGNVCTFLSYETKCEGECSWVTYKEMEEQLKRAEKRIVELNKTIKAKEQECERLMEETTLALRLGNDILRLFEVSEYDWLADQNEIIDIFRAYKMEAGEGKEINAELKAENEELKKKLNCINIK